MFLLRSRKAFRLAICSLGKALASQIATPRVKMPRFAQDDTDGERSGIADGGASRTSPPTSLRFPTTLATARPSFSLKSFEGVIGGTFSKVPPNTSP